ncbi:MAG: hypothetical protein JWM27_3666 [Gemmatimonadetes bacterium]|nr:hypothetical protein [Gemmatimonadota bacterium]
MEDSPAIQRDSASWLFFVRASFALALAANIAGIVFLPVEAWIRGYLAMGLMFVVGSAITLTKTLRDDHEAGKLLNRIAEVKTTRLLKEYDVA